VCGGDFLKQRRHEEDDRNDRRDARELGVQPELVHEDCACPDGPPPPCRAALLVFVRLHGDDEN